MRAMFFSSIAHELRTPLNSIIPMIKMILSNFLDSIDDRVKNFLQIILNSSLHLQNVIEDALDMSRIENNKFSIFKEMFDIGEAIREVSQIMEFQVKQKNLSLEIEIADSVPQKIMTDQKRYKQVLFNLIGNAVKFTFHGGIKVIVWFELGDLYTQIDDTGIGIVEEDLNKLFKFFGQISKSKNINRGGMGLGLTISKMIVQQLEGEIYVKSTNQVGSSFTFKIPISEYQYDHPRHIHANLSEHEEIKEMHPNQSIESDSESCPYSVGDELSRDNEISKDDREHNLSKNLQILDRSFTTNYNRGKRVSDIGNSN